jgi:DNA-binding winged helix-turn-helix (wHTH) protein
MVVLVGIDELALVPQYLDLGAVVVIAPDRGSLRRWQRDQDPPEHGLGGLEDRPADGLVIDLARRRVSCGGRQLPATQLEFRVLAALTAVPYRAWSFRQLREVGWGEGPSLPFDLYSVRSLVQRLRVKLRAAESPVRIEAVRGYGFRMEPGIAGSEPQGRSNSAGGRWGERVDGAARDAG